VRDKKTIDTFPAPCPDWATVTVHTFPGVPFPLTAEGVPACQAEVQGSAVALTAGPKSDLFLDPAGDGTGPDAGRFLGEPPAGDFTLRARADVDFGSTYDAAVLLVYVSPVVWAKLCFEFSPQGRPTVVTVVTRGTSDDANSFEVEGASVWLRVTRSGPAWAFHASAGGDHWRLVRYFSLGEREPGETARVGFLAQSPMGETCRVLLNEIAFASGAPADLRDGS
jgi:uncharacterized protein